MNTSPTKTYFDHKPGYGISNKRLQGITSLLGDFSDVSLLDIGCGSGSLGAYLKERGAKKVVGCDIADGAILEAKTKLDSAFLYDVTEKNLAHLANGEIFDVVIATELIEHLFAPKQLLEEVKTVLKPGGVFIVTTPNVLVWMNRIRFLFGKFEYTKTGLMDESHVHFFTYASLRSLLEDEGFEVVQEANVYDRRIPRLFAPFIKGLATYQMIFACKVK